MPVPVTVTRSAPVTGRAPARWVGMVTLPLDPELSDPDLGSEIELLADVIDVASAAPAALTEAEVDDLLGVAPADGGPQEA
jgi:hypothetical protein